MRKILVAGSVAYDRIMDYAGNFTDHIIADKLHTLSISFQVDTIEEHFGGTAGNVAYTLALLGEQPDIVATVGTDFGRYEEHLLNANVNISTILNDPNGLTSVAHIVTDKADNQIAAFAMAAGGKPYGELPDISEYVCAMLGAGCIADTVAIAEAAKAAGVDYYFDVGQAITAFTAAQLRSVVDGASGLFANDYELSLIVEKTGWDERELLHKTPLVVVTLGANGAQLRTPEGTHHVRSVHVEKLVDPTGAGDAHRAGFVKGLLSGLSLVEAAQLASVTAAYAIEHYGTQRHSFTLADVKKRYADSYGQELAL